MKQLSASGNGDWKVSLSLTCGPTAVTCEEVKNASKDKSKVLAMCRVNGKLVCLSAKEAVDLGLATQVGDKYTLIAGASATASFEDGTPTAVTGQKVKLSSLSDAIRLAIAEGKETLAQHNAEV